MKKLWGIFSLVTVLFVLAACGEEKTTSRESQQGEQESKEELKIFTTVYPLQFFTEQIAGGAASVESILPPGSDPHTYEPTTKEMIAIAEADAFIYNGAGLEPYANQISDSIESEDVQILEASNGIDLEEHVHNHAGEGAGDDPHTHEEEEGHHDEEDGHHHGDEDPHIWLDPLRSIQMAEHIKGTLVELLPEQEEAFNKNFEALKGKLEDLDQEFHTEIEGLPGNKMIVSHAAYGYWEQAYGIEQLAISGLSPTNEPSQKEVQTIIDLAEEYGLNHVFFEQNVTPKVGEVVREEISAEILRIHNLSVLTEEDIQNKEDYFSIMQHNLKALTKALADSKPVSEKEEKDGHDHDHNHSHDQGEEKIYEGYFKDSQVKDRPLSDWEGDWQSLYPYLQDGTLDDVFAHKAEEGDKTAKEYKEYYTEGYQTDVDRIVIRGNTVSFYEKGKETSGEYHYDGYEILTYEAGNRGVRYIFERSEEVEELPAYIQFSDHSIDPTVADHYHLYWGDDRNALLEEVTNWPTYYPSHMNGQEIAREMMAH
ncbi:metal ABC transporter solute-binding protein, Zn/Mn family [Halobacillus karajensis]|uniref:Cadmium-induced protein ZinT n=1 Tax=Halobacillus karajensis TaxID=195088 RepID=A0A024P670_9BACI|nr:ZinT/AdcA family metal-binding protein [Halobacillus karajensis]CDQ20683.1 Cadmium-induced protein ZinT [Halobacillus karajensis]CDQ23847.1 Cadmium-induced protein ZinT [Halobacillus karajensis]CDQ27325.1 Cadmium-induced protein ZinT [Halobacillus karajensis]